MTLHVRCPLSWTFHFRPKGAAVQALFVHGMGRSPLSGWRLLARLRRAGFRTHTLGYATPLQTFDSIKKRLVVQLEALSATDDDYIVIGHSLGGVLLRAAIAGLPPGTHPPRQIFLLGSPIQAARLAQALQRHWLYRILAGDCGQLLASPARMAAIGSTPIPTLCILGITGWKGRLNPFEGAENDGIVSVLEARAPWAEKEIRIPAIHTCLPSNRQVSGIILAQLAASSVSD